MGLVLPMLEGGMVIGEPNTQYIIYVRAYSWGVSYCSGDKGRGMHYEELKSYMYGDR